MANKRSLNKLCIFSSVFIAVLDKQTNIRCCFGSISRPISSRDRNATDQTFTIDRCQSYFGKLDNFFSGKQQVTVRIDQKIHSLLIYDFCIVVRIFKVATSLSITSITRFSLAQQRKQMKTIKFDNA